MTLKVNQVIDSVVQELQGEDYSVGGLLHGSFAAGQAHPESDVDILCVTNADWLSKEIRQIDGLEVEIQKIPESKIRRDLGHRSATNNNFTLTILCEGRVLFDKQGCMRSLVEEANTLWQNGPPKPSPFEVCMGRSFFRHRLEEVRRLVREDDPPGFARAKMDLLFFNAVYGYCKTHEKWASKLRHLMKRFEAEAPEFHALCVAFLSSASNDEGLKWIESIVEAVMEPVGWGSRFYETPRVPLSHAGQMKDGMLF